MHTINRCPRCGENFIYHWSDNYLFRTETFVDEVGNNEIVDIVICQKCDEIEKLKINDNTKNNEDRQESN